MENSANTLLNNFDKKILVDCKLQLEQFKRISKTLKYPIKSLQERKLILELNIFPNIYQDFENLYKSYDEFNINNNINNVFRIPKKKEAEKYIDKRNDSLGKIVKLYYFFLL